MNTEIPSKSLIGTDQDQKGKREREKEKRIEKERKGKGTKEEREEISVKDEEYATDVTSMSMNFSKLKQEERGKRGREE